MCTMCVYKRNDKIDNLKKLLYLNAYLILLFLAPLTIRDRSSIHEQCVCVCVSACSCVCKCWHKIRYNIPGI